VVDVPYSISQLVTGTPRGLTLPSSVAFVKVTSSLEPVVTPGTTGPT
jgi:hypothetical protein